MRLAVVVGVVFVFASCEGGRPITVQPDVRDPQKCMNCDITNDQATDACDRLQATCIETAQKPSDQGYCTVTRSDCWAAAFDTFASCEGRYCPSENRSALWTCVADCWRELSQCQKLVADSFKSCASAPTCDPGCLQSCVDTANMQMEMCRTNLNNFCRPDCDRL